MSLPAILRRTTCALVHVGRVLDGALAAAARVIVATYKLAVSPFLPPACRYYPTCSVYAAEALKRHGFLRGGWLAAKRVARCHPWSPGGVDPVPAAHAHLDHKGICR